MSLHHVSGHTMHVLQSFSSITEKSIPAFSHNCIIHCQLAKFSSCLNEIWDTVSQPLLGAILLFPFKLSSNTLFFFFFKFLQQQQQQNLDTCTENTVWHNDQCCSTASFNSICLYPPASFRFIFRLWILWRTHYSLVPSTLGDKKIFQLTTWSPKHLCKSTPKPLVTCWPASVYLTRAMLFQLPVCSVTGNADMAYINLSNAFINVLPAINTIRRERGFKYPAFCQNSKQRAAGVLCLPRTRGF